MRSNPPRTILVRAPNWLGDAVMFEPALSGLHSLFPEAELTLLAKAPVAELFSKDPKVAHHLLYDDKGEHAGLTGKWALASTLRRYQFEMAILFQNAFEAAFITWLAGIPRRYGYVTDGRALFLTDPVAVPDRRSQLHQVEYYWNLLKPLGLVGTVPRPTLAVSREEDEAFTTRLSAAGINQTDLIIGINPGSTYGGAKRWLPDRFAEAASKVARQVEQEAGKPVSMVILGAKGEEHLGNSIAAMLEKPAVVLSGATTIRELMATVKRCRLLLTNDTGPMHIAAACGVPVVAVFGPTDWRTTSPYGQEHAVVRESVDCAPCLLRECPIDHRCMTRVTVGHVYEASLLSLSGSAGLSRLAVSHQMDPLDQKDMKDHIGHTMVLSGYTIFLDRDGTLNPDPGYIRFPEQFDLFPGVAEALARLKRAGARLILITNQSGIARGLLSVRELEAVHLKLQDLLGTVGASLDAIYFCPHHPDDQCSCRKPNPGMIDRASREQQVDLGRSYLIGDQTRDVELAKRVGVRSILVTTGKVLPHQAEELRQTDRSPDRIAGSLTEAVEWLISDVGGRLSDGRSREMMHR